MDGSAPWNVSGEGANLARRSGEESLLPACSGDGHTWILPLGEDRFVVIAPTVRPHAECCLTCLRGVARRGPSVASAAGRRLISGG